MTRLAPLLEEFFTDRLINQRHVSPNTIAAYRDTFRLLVVFTHDTLGTQPCDLDLADLDATVIGGFLTHLETERGVGIRTRNARLTAIRSLFQFASYRHPEHGATISRVLSIPPKRTERAIVTFLTKDEIQALLDAPDPSTRLGRRDRAVLALDIKQGYVSPNSSDSPAVTSNSAPEPTFAATAKDAKTASPRSTNPPDNSSGTGSTNTPAHRRTHSSPARPAKRSPVTPSVGSLTVTSPPPPPTARRWQPRTSPHTRFVTPAPWDSSKPASTLPSSPSGSATKTYAPPRSTSTPTSA